MAVLKAENLTKFYDDRAVVRGINLEFRSGEIIGLLGRNGAGKTTTFQMIVGLIKPDKGRIFLDDEEVTAFPSFRRALAGLIYLPQENSVFLRTTVENNLRLILELLPGSKELKKEKLEKLLAQFHLTELRRQGAHTLSGGEQRKLEIARALTLNPKFLLLDEPFTGVDPLSILELQRIALRLKEENIGLVLSDHNVYDTFKICDRVYIIDEGEVLCSGQPAEVAADNQARARFLGPDFTFTPSP